VRKGNLDIAASGGDMEIECGYLGVMHIVEQIFRSIKHTTPYDCTLDTLFRTFHIEQRSWSLKSSYLSIARAA
jgi:hypothetical protein